MMSFTTLSRRSREFKHHKQNSFDVSELATSGRLSTSSGSDNKPVPRSPLRRLTQFFKRQNSEPVKTSQSHPSLLSNQQINSSTQIFGRDLKDVCTPELPRPIMDLLIFLQEVGPYTREIFRKPPNARGCRLLGEKINSADFYWDVDESCNGLLLAAVFKTFLREIPHKLCDDRLYDQWSAVISDTNSSRQRKISSIKRLLCLLPEANQKLMVYLISVLHRIQLHSDKNLMTCYNLSVCLGPCILWTQSTKSIELEKASQTIPKLLQFIVTHAVQIFGAKVLDMLVAKGESTLNSKASVSLDSVFTSERTSRYVTADSCHSIDTLTMSTDKYRRQQLSPSRLSHDSGMILDDASHDEELHNTNHVHRRQSQINRSYDSLGCDIECCSEDELANNNNTLTSYNVNKALTITRATYRDDKLKPTLSSDSKGIRLSNNQQIKTVSNTIKPHDTHVVESFNQSKHDKTELSSPHHTRSISDIIQLPALDGKKQYKYTNQLRNRVTTAHKRNTVHAAPKQCRPAILPQSLQRKSSVLYDKVVYRYISDPQRSTVPNDYVTLPRRARIAKPTSTLLPAVSDIPDAKINNNNSKVPYGQSIWGNRSDAPIIVIDECKPSRPHHVTSTPISLHRVNSCLVTTPRSIFPSPERCYKRRDTTPIHESSVLYGSSTTRPQPKRRPSAAVPCQAPLYENLPFHRQINIRQRPRRSTVASGSSYSTYREAKRKDSLLTQQALAAKLTQGQGLVSSHVDSENSRSAQPQSFHETCYFV